MVVSAEIDRVMIFVDHANFGNLAQEYGRFPDLLALRDYLAKDEEGRHLLEMVVYIGLPPEKKPEDMPDQWRKDLDSRTRLRHKLEHEGIMVVVWHGRAKGEEKYEANVDALMAVDAVEFAMETRPDTVVLVTGDADFSYLANKLRRRGIRVEAAGMDTNTSPILRRAVNDFIDLTKFFNSLPGDKIGDEEAFFDARRT